jgi:acyl-CoA synthetase (AMP-forming)/AMP-acid ligase II
VVQAVRGEFEQSSVLPPAVPGTLGETLRLNALHFGKAMGAGSDERSLTHEELYRRGHRLAAGLQALGITRDQRIAMLAMNCVEMLEIYAAAEISGIPVVPLNFRLSAAEQAAVLRDCRPSVLFFEDQLAPTILGARHDIAHCIAIGDAPAWAHAYEPFIAGAAEAAEWATFADDALACVLYTSGTTGQPKGCMYTHRGFRSVGALMAAKMGLTASDRGLIMMPLFHMGGKAVQLGLHWSGGELFIQRGFDPLAVLQAIERERITVTHMAPTMIQTLLDHPQLDSFDLSSLRVIFYSAAPMPEPVLRKGLDRLGAIFIQSYGQTEITGTVLPARCHRLDGSEADRRHLTSVGIPPRGVDVRIVDDGGRPCATDCPGEVLMRSPAAMAGYWNNPEATRETLFEGWVRTGDIGLVDEQGFLFLVDRKKDVIISGGENIYSREVENALYAHPEVAEAAVIGLPDPQWGEAVCAVVVRVPGSALDAEAVIAHCRSLIAGYKRPRAVRFVDDLPKLANGKIDKKALRAAEVGPSASADGS